MILAHLTVVVSSMIGWQDIKVQASRGDRAHASLQRSLSELDRASERTLETLRRYNLERRYAKDIDGALAALEKLARNHPDPDVVYALAELFWVEGQRLDRRRRAGAIDKYVDAVAYAYDFLFDPDLAAGRQPADPRFILACHLYNGGLDRLIRAAQSGGQIMPEGTITLKVHGGKQVLRVALMDSAWKASDVDQIVLASDYEVSGVVAQSRLHGLGVPLIGIHKPAEPGKGSERFYPPEMAFPLTAFLRPNSRLRETEGNIGEPRECTLELVDPIRVRKVGTPRAELPVEADFTTPLGYMWSRTDLNRFRWTGLFRPGKEPERANLMLLRPYEPGKIPVVMVHGLISSPLAWIPMINDLLRDPVIHDRYQFMLYMYPTGVSIPIAAAGLRETLAQSKQMYNPDGRDPAFDRMVLLGHSMGGILGHAMAIESGEKFWQLNTDRSFQTIVGEADVLAQLNRYLYFQPLPFVKRVVFLATPHRGSDFSRNMIGRVGSGLISDPDQITELLSKLVRANPDAFGRSFQRMPTSIESLNTDHKLLLALLAMKPNPDVRFHSVIGSKEPGGVDTTTDGVVPYRSAHIEGPEVESEKVVRSDHGVQKAPEAILEVRRILHKHLELSPSLATPIASPNQAPRQAALPAVEHPR